MSEDIRWIQRFDNFQRAMKQLDSAIALQRERDLSRLEVQGVIQAFEYNYELAWNVVKDFYRYQDGSIDIQGSRDAFRTAFNRGLVADGKIWMDMIKSRTLTVHTYNEKVAEHILEDIINQYYPALSTLRATLLEKLNDDG
jgi:nucleotidyltransferase substrate binding protein (TIGR01987 family)